MDLDSPDHISDFLSQVDTLSLLNTISTTQAKPVNGTNSPKAELSEAHSPSHRGSPERKSSLVWDENIENHPEASVSVIGEKESKDLPCSERHDSLVEPKEAKLYRSRASTLAEQHQLLGVVAPPPSPQAKATYGQDAEKDSLVGMHIVSQLANSATRDLKDSVHARPTSLKQSLHTHVSTGSDHTVKTDGLTTTDFGALENDMTSFLSKRSQGSRERASSRPKPSHSQDSAPEKGCDKQQDSNGVEGWTYSAVESQYQPHASQPSFNDDAGKTSTVSKALLQEHHSDNNHDFDNKTVEAPTEFENVVKDQEIYEKPKVTLPTTVSPRAVANATLKDSGHAFDSWPAPLHRSGPAAVPRSVRISRLPMGATPQLVASIVFGGPVESIVMGLGGMAKVTFVRGKDRDVYVEATQNGMVWTTDRGLPKYVDIDPIADVDVMGQKMQSLVDGGATRCLYAISDKVHKTAADLKGVRGVKSLKFESVEEGLTAPTTQFNFRMCSINDAVELKKALALDDEWETFNVVHYADPCSFEYLSERRKLHFGSGRSFSPRD